MCDGLKGLLCGLGVKAGADADPKGGGVDDAVAFPVPKLNASCWLVVFPNAGELLLVVVAEGKPMPLG